jgi:hypothetical protein
MNLDLRPLTLGELFDRAFVLYRRHFWLFVGITAIPGVFALLGTLAQLGLQQAMMPNGGAQAADAEPQIESFLLIFWLFAGMMLALVIYWVVYMIALGATTFAVSEIYVGRGTTIASVYDRVRGRIGALILLLLLVGLRIFGLGFVGLVVIGFVGGLFGVIFAPLAVLLVVTGAAVLIAGCVFLALRYSLSIPALVLEGLTASNSITRSIELTQGRLLRVLLLGICATLVTYAALVIFQGPFFAAAMMSGPETSAGLWLGVIGAVFGTIGTTLTTPFLIIGLALMYYDARVREEGLDLELSLAALDRA